MRSLTGIVLACLAMAQDAPREWPCRIHGRLLGPEGAPLSGARLTLRGWPLLPPATWNDPAPLETSANGAFEFTFVPPEYCVFILAVEHAKLGRLEWRWEGLPRGEDVDLGDTRLELPGIVQGHIVDTQGNLLVEGWRIDAIYNEDPYDLVSVISDARIDPRSGTFRIADLPPGRIQIRAWHDTDEGTEYEEIETSSGELTEVQIVYSGPEIEKRLIVFVSTSPFSESFQPRAGTIHARSSTGERHPLSPRSYGNAWVATGLASGDYRVEIDDPRFELARPCTAHTGQRARMQLRGSACVRVTCRAPSSTDPLVAYGLRVEYPDVEFPNVFTLLEDGAPAPLEGSFYVVPGNIELEVRAAGLPRKRVTVSGLSAKETRDVSIELDPGHVLRGKVVGADGSPAAGIRIQVTPGEIPGHDGWSEMMRFTTTMVVAGERRTVDVPYREHERLTGADGCFEIVGLPGGKNAVRVPVSPWCTLDLVMELPRPAAEGAATITLPPVGDVDIALKLPPSSRPTSLMLQVCGQDGWPEGFEGASIEPDGRCSLKGVPAGDKQLRLVVGWPGVVEKTVDLGPVRIEPGERAKAAFDLRDRL